VIQAWKKEEGAAEAPTDVYAEKLEDRAIDLLEGSLGTSM